jgi:competence protein ComEC
MTHLQWAKGLGPVCLAWCLGVALQLQQEALWSHAAYVGAVSLALSTLAFRPWPAPAWVRALGVLAIWVAVSFSVTGWHALSRSQAIAPQLEGQDLDVVGVVQAMPQKQSTGWRFRFQIEQAWRLDASGALQPVDMATALPAQVSLGWFAPGSAFSSDDRAAQWPEPVKAGERWRLRVRLQAPHGNMNPRGIDYELWLWERGIRATGYVRSGAKDPTPQRLATTWAYPIEGWRQAVRGRILQHLAPDAGDAQAAKLAGVVAALVTGDQAAIDRSDWDVFRITGVAHLMSISGLHVTMFAWLASALVAWAWRKSALWGFSGPLHWPAVHVGAVCGLMLATFYALFSGWGIPAQRTLLMLLVVVVLKISARHWHGVTVWLSACAVVLVWDPWALLQPGFWLSFVAVGVLMAHRPQGTNTHWDAPIRGDETAPTWRSQGMVAVLRHHAGAQGLARGGALGLHKAGALLREQATITLALAPLTLLFFGQVSLVGLLANLLAIPWVTLVITPLAMLGVFWSQAWVLAAWALQPLSSALNWMATWPLASVSLAMPPWGLALLALLGALACVVRLPLSWKLLCLPLLWPVLWWSNPRPAHGGFELLAVDVGQGNAVLVRTATHSLLYDAGPRFSAHSDAGQRVLVPLLAHMGERIDVLMLSHRDSDHTGGAAAVLAAHPQARLSSSLEDEHPLHALRPDWRRCHAGQSWVWDGVLFEVLHPALGATSRRPNEVSCVLRISHGGRAALLAGDIEAAQERALVQAGLGPVDVLLVPHHGSKTSSTAPFLQALQPRVALVQAAYRSRFGHPAPEVVARYQDMGSKLVQSSRCGAATWRSEAPEQVQCERVLRKRYWHHAMAP